MSNSMDLDVQTLARTLLETGSVSWADPQGKTVFMSYAAVIGAHHRPRDFVVGREGGGVLFFQTGAAINRFQLMEAGFGLIHASHVAVVVNRLLGAVSTVYREEAKKLEKGEDPEQ